MSTTENGLSQFENYEEGTRTDPNSGAVVNANGDATRVILNLGDAAKTILVNDDVEQIVLLNKLVEWRSNREVELDADGNVVGIDKSGGDGAQLDGGSTIAFTNIDSGYGIHIAATTGDESDNKNGQGPKLDGLGYERGHEAKKIDTRDADGNISDELLTLFQIALKGGDAGSEDDINLRVGNIQTGNEADGTGFVVEILVDGKWSTDVLKITGKLAQDLLIALPNVDVKNNVEQFSYKGDFDGGTDTKESIFIGNSSALPKDSTDDTAIVHGVEVVFNDVFDLSSEIVKGKNNFGGDELRPQETTLIIQAGVFMALTGQNVIDGLEVVFEGDPDTTDTVTIKLTNTSGVTDTILVQGPGVSAAIASGLGPYSSADFGTVSVEDYKSDNEAIFLQLIQNTAPIAEDGSASGDEDTTISGSATASDLDAPDADLVFSVDTGPANGVLTLNGDGTFEYDPNDDFFGTDSFIFAVEDEDGLVDTGEITLTVNPVNDAPTATSIDAGSVTEDDAPVTIDLLSTASDIDNLLSELSVNGITVTDEDGSVAFTNNGDGTITVDPAQYDALNNGEARNITVNYNVSDGELGFANTASLEVTGVDDGLSDGVFRAAFATGSGLPWRQEEYGQSMDTAFGPSNWDQFNNSFTNLFDGTYDFVWLDGSDREASWFRSYINLYRDDIESFVADGGAIYLNAARNTDFTQIDLGFGVTLLNSSGGDAGGLSTYNQTVTTTADASVLKTGAAASISAFTGNSYTHDSVRDDDGDLTVFLEGANANTIALAGQEFGDGYAMFGGRTSSNFHRPNAAADQLEANILDYAASFTDDYAFLV